MRIVVILAVVWASVAIAIVLYVVSARRRPSRKIVLQGKNESRHDEAQQAVECEPSIQSPAPETVQLVPALSSVRPESKLTVVAEIPPSFGGGPEPAAETGLSGLIEQNILQTPEAEPKVTETEKPREAKPHFGVLPPQPAIEAQAESHRKGTEDPFTAAKNDSADAIELINDHVEQAVPENEGTPPPKPRTVSPEKRGGRSRAEAQATEADQTRRGRPRTPKPEIVCWKKEREWVLAVEIPEELRKVSVIQNGVRLTEDELEKGCWRLAELCGELMVSTLENEYETQFKIELSDENYLVFKLSGVHQNQGRHVKRPACGSYLAVVPADWQRDEELAGPAPATPENVSLGAYRAHFFYLRASQQR